MGAYFWGYLTTSLPAGMIAEKFGGRGVVGYALLLSGCFTALSPIAAGFGFYALYIVRFFVGVCGVSICIKIF